MKLNHAKQLLIAAVAVAGFTSASHAAVLAQYNFAGGSAVASTVASNVTAGNVITNGINPTNISFSATGGNVALRSTISESTQALALADMAAALDEYFQVTISAAPGKTLNLTDVTFLLGHTTDGPTSFTSTAVLTSNVNGFGTAITGTGGISRTTAATTASAFNATAANFNLSAPAYQGLNTITFRLALFDDLQENGKFTRFDDFTLNGTVIPEPSAALLSSIGLLALLRRRRI